MTQMPFPQTVTWHLIQYTADMRRREPRNVPMNAVASDSPLAARRERAGRRISRKVTATTKPAKANVNIGQKPFRRNPTAMVSALSMPAMGVTSSFFSVDQPDVPQGSAGPRPIKNNIANPGGMANELK